MSKGLKSIIQSYKINPVCNISSALLLSMPQVRLCDDITQKLSQLMPGWLSVFHLTINGKAA